ncbi:MAG: UDP-3-O-(3-hydroxymyristoyl)glucosamine N-acyltransferase [Candidatus Eremiobacteraeota bacterium]|nr:UDP-3-O-(3-hydroxymyristoyl)glucosamine N-acyltransferase [Candidatus Eremiobacteraeota bacterium]
MLGTLAQLAARIGGRVIGDRDVAVSRIASIDDAQSDALTFATTESYVQSALRSKACAVLLDEKLAPAQAEKPLIVVPNARAALAQLLSALDRPRKRGPFRHPSAVIDPSATVPDDAYIGPGVVIGARSVVGRGTTLEACAYVGENVRIGEGALLYPYAKIMDGCTIGDRCIIHPGAVVGSDGFGFVFVDNHFERIPQVGNVALGNDVEVGANTCIDRAQTGTTSIGDGTKIDNLCQIGHNCRVGKHTAMAAQAGLAGSTNIGDYVMVGGQVGFIGHITVGSRVKIGGGSVVWSDVPDDAFISGRPARSHRDELKRQVLFQNLPKLLARVEALEGKQRG